MPATAGGPGDVFGSPARPISAPPANSVSGLVPVVARTQDARAVLPRVPQPYTSPAAAGEDAEAPVVRVVNSLLRQAVLDGASDVHFEPKATGLLVRYRVDSVLHSVATLPSHLAQGVISRLKVMAELDIAERRVPQDGRAALSVAGKHLDLRVASLPTVHGEKLVLRLLDKDTAGLQLDQLGFGGQTLAQFHDACQRAHGAVLVTGPTGSGKSTTLYAALAVLDSTERNIVTVEDPVEYELAGISQVPVNRRAGLTFATALRAILRCDPDVVMVGEIRDRETAQIAVQSALTGHLVFSTLHTNDAPGAISRLTEMGVEPFLTASAVTAVVSQRLVRRLCPACRAPYELTEAAAQAGGLAPEACRDGVRLFRAAGCAQCRGTGYRGRVGLYEVMAVTDRIRLLAMERASAVEIARAAREEGMCSLREDGTDKVLRGVTSLAEMLRVTA